MKGVTLFLTIGCLSLALLVLLGWQTGIEFLKNPLSESVAINPATALCFALLSGSILLLQRAQKYFLYTGYTLTLLCFLLAGYRLLEGLFSFGSYSDQMLFLETLRKEGSGTLSMSPNSAVTFLLLTFALILLTRGKAWAGQFVTSLAMMIASFTLLGHINRVPEFLGLLPYLPMALFTALCFLLLCVSLYVMHPDKGITAEITSPLLGGKMARIFLPVVFVVPMLFGHLRLLLHWDNMVSTEFGVSVLIVSIILFFSLMMIFNIILLNQQDSVRRKNEQALTDANSRLKESNQEVVSLHEEMVAAYEGLTMMNEQLYSAGEKIKEQAAVIIQQKDEHLNRALDSSNAFIWSVDLTEEKQHYISRSAEKISGIQVADFLCQRDTWNRFVVAEDLETLDTAVHRLKQDGQSEAIIRVKACNGGIRWINFQMKIVTNESGQPIRQEGMAVDLTSIKQSENALMKERSLLRSIIDNIPDYIFVKDLSLHYIMNNKASLSLLNESSEEESKGKTSNDYFGKDADAFHQDELRVLSNGEVVINKEEVIHATAGSRAVLTTRVPLRDGLGDIQGIVGISRDITESRKSEQLLNQYRENLDIIFQATLEEILLLDKEGKVVLFNNALEKFITASIGKRPMIGNYLWDITAPERRDKARHLFDLAISGHSNTTEAYLKTTEGVVVHELRYRPIFISGEVKYVMLISLDITERRKHEDKTRTSEGNLRAIFNSTTDSFILLDMDFRILTFNESFRKSGLLSVESQEGMILTELVSKERKDTFISYLNYARQGKQFEYELSTTQEGKVTWHQITISPVKDKSEQVIGICITSHDLTIRKQAEMERTNFIRRLTDQNNDLLQFSFITSHQLRGPVASMLGLLDLIHPEQVSGDLAQLLSFIGISVRHLDTVIGDLSLILSLREEEPQVKEWINIRKLVDSIRTELASQLLESKAALNIITEEVVSFFCSRVYLHSIVYQLISNSLRFREVKRPLVIDIVTFSDETGNGFTVTDNGRGIDMSRFKDKIFKLYQRFHLDVEGKGLGLFIVYTQVQQMDGIIQVNSEVDKGANFTVKFMKD